MLHIWWLGVLVAGRGTIYRSWDAALRCLGCCTTVLLLVLVLVLMLVLLLLLNVASERRLSTGMRRLYKMGLHLRMMEMLLLLLLMMMMLLLL